MGPARGLPRKQSRLAAPGRCPRFPIARQPLPGPVSQSELRGAAVGILRETGLAPDLLDLELTENIVMEDADAVARRSSSLRDLGIGLAIDDFGTGYPALPLSSGSRSPG